MVAYNHPTAFCPVHGLFEATGFSFATDVTILHSETTCPICGRTAEIIPGRYEAAYGSIKLLVDPSISKPALIALRDIAERLRRKEITPDQAATEATKINSKVADALRLGAWAIPLIVALLTLYYQIADGRAADVQNKEILSALSKQTDVLERIVSLLSKEANENPTPEPQHQTSPKAKAEPTAEQPKSKRRQEVNRERRLRVKARKEEFGGARRH